MPEPTTFGRRPAACPPTPRDAGPTQGLGKASEPSDAKALSAEAEAFRRSLKSDPQSGPPDFAHWRRSQTGRRVIFWIASAALLAPGVISFVIDMPLNLSGGLGILGIAGNWWLRRERKRHLNEIASWEG
ncbi:MAG TPA: hypothetical protein VE309_03485 [Caulobacteraceae bacterium]|nr:hypothetical protein [Caulobacteraceae bacterium]